MTRILNTNREFINNQTELIMSIPLGLKAALYGDIIDLSSFSKIDSDHMNHIDFAYTYYHWIQYILAMSQSLKTMVYYKVNPTKKNSISLTTACRQLYNAQTLLCPELLPVFFFTCRGYGIEWTYSFTRKDIDSYSRWISDYKKNTKKTKIGTGVTLNLEKIAWLIRSSNGLYRRDCRVAMYVWENNKQGIVEHSEPMYCVSSRTWNDLAELDQD